VADLLIKDITRQWRISRDSVMKSLKSGKVSGRKDSEGRWTFTHAEVVRWRGEPRADDTRGTSLKDSKDSDLKDDLIAVLKEQLAIKDTQIADLSEITKNQALRLSAPEPTEAEASVAAENEILLKTEIEVIALPDETNEVISEEPALAALMNFKAGVSVAKAPLLASNSNEALDLVAEPRSLPTPEPEVLLEPENEAIELPDETPKEPAPKPEPKANPAPVPERNWFQKLFD
jgi:hypothetical protein